MVEMSLCTHAHVQVGVVRREDHCGEFGHLRSGGLAPDCFQKQPGVPVGSSYTAVYIPIFGFGISTKDLAVPRVNVGILDFSYAH